MTLDEAYETLAEYEQHVGESIAEAMMGAASLGYDPYDGSREWMMNHSEPDVVTEARRIVNEHDARAVASVVPGYDPTDDIPF